MSVAPAGSMKYFVPAAVTAVTVVTAVIGVTDDVVTVATINASTADGITVVLMLLLL